MWTVGSHRNDLNGQKLHTLTARFDRYVVPPGQWRCTGHQIHLLKTVLFNGVKPEKQSVNCYEFSKLQGESIIKQFTYFLILKKLTLIVQTFKYKTTHFASHCRSLATSGDPYTNPIVGGRGTYLCQWCDQFLLRYVYIKINILISLKLKFVSGNSRKLNSISKSGIKV